MYDLTEKYPNLGFIRPIAAPLASACRVANRAASTCLEVAEAVVRQPRADANGKRDERGAIVVAVSLASARSLEEAARQLREAATAINSQQEKSVALDGDSKEVLSRVVGGRVFEFLSFISELSTYGEEFCRPLEKQLFDE
jgi:hypothetical protein